MEVDIACVGFGPATGGFLHTLVNGLNKSDGTPIAESKAMPGMPPQVICYERADDLSFGVSGVVTRGRAIKQSLPDFDASQVPMSAEVTRESVAYLLDPVGASRRPAALRMADVLLKPLCKKHHAFELPWIPGFLQKEPGYIFSIGQFNQWVGSQVMGSGLAQIWPSSPVSQALIEDDTVVGIRLLDQGTDKSGKPDAGYSPGMDIKASLTVVGDGPVGNVGQQLDAHFKMPEGHHKRDWAVGMKAVVELPADCKLKPGEVIHTLGYPEPEIFGFMYVLPDNLASVGIFVPSWLQNSSRTAYRYLQHWMQHPYLWRYLKGGTLRSWGAKSLDESGKVGEPFLAGNGYARIGEGSGSTNVLTNSGVDEAWGTGVQLAEAVIDLYKQDKAFTKENLESTYVKRRSDSWIDKEATIAKNARNGFHKGFLRGLIGTGMAGLTKGLLSWPATPKRLSESVTSPEEYYSGLSASEIEDLRKTSKASGAPLHDAIMDKAGWPAIPFDGKLLITQQDALLMGGKVQAPPSYADHVTFKDEQLCAQCSVKTCVEMCSGQALAIDPNAETPLFDREKCVHCGACLWNCTKADKSNPELTNISFVAGAGGFHSAEN